MKLAHTFRQARKKWGGNGSGSTEAKTKSLVSGLITLLHELEVKSLLDFGCGSFDWMAPVAAAVAEYTGVDVVPEVTEENAKKYPGLSFLTLTEDSELPQVDLILCRDTLAHLSNVTALETLAMLKRTRSKYLLTSHYVSARNISIQDGAFRPINLQRIPFVFPEPRKVIQEGFEGKALALWRFDQILPSVVVPPPPLPPPPSPPPEESAPEGLDPEPSSE